MERSRRASLLLGIGTTLLAITVAVWGLAARDLAGDEQNMLHGSPAQIFSWSLDPRGGFVGHLPLSFWARWVSLSLFSEMPAWAWRVHAVVFSALAAVLTALTAHRYMGLAAGLVAGALVCLDPIVAFHAQEASNYSASVLTGIVMVRGLLDVVDTPRQGAAWLAAGLLLGATNDFYSVLLAGPALALSLWMARSPTARRPLAAAWLGVALTVLPFAGLFVLRLLESTGNAVLDVHADPLPPRPLPALLDAPWRVARRFFGAHLHGYAGGRNDAPWIGLPPVLFGLLALGATWRSRIWPAAAMVGASLALHGLLGVGLQLGAERILPYEPRSLIGLTPPLALAVAALAAQTTGPRLLRVAPAALWFLAAAASTLEARLSPANLRQAAVQHAREVAPGLPLVVPEDRTRARATDAVACLPDPTPAFVVVSNHTAESSVDCAGTDPLPAPVHRQFFDAPVHEGSAASFLPRRVVAVYGAPVAPVPVSVERSLLDGISAATWTHTDPSGATLARGPSPEAFPRMPGTTFLRASATAPAWLPDHILFRAFRNEVQAFELDPLDQRPVLRAAPFRSPSVVTARLLLPLLGAVLSLLLAARRP